MTCESFFYSDEIESHTVQKDSFSTTVVFDRKKNGSFFRTSKSFLWSPEEGVRTKFHLDENILIILFCDNIDLSTLDRIVRLDNLIVVFLEVLDRNEFSLVSGFSSVFHES